MDIRKELGVSSIQEKVREMRLRWYGHMQRMEENEVKAVGDMRVPAKRQQGRPRGRWMDGVRRDMQSLRITPEDAQGSTIWKSRIRAADPTKWEKPKKKKIVTGARLTHEKVEGVLSYKFGGVRYAVAVGAVETDPDPGRDVWQ